MEAACIDRIVDPRLPESSRAVDRRETIYRTLQRALRFSTTFDNCTKERERILSSGNEEETSPASVGSVITKIEHAS